MHNLMKINEFYQSQYGFVQLNWQSSKFIDRITLEMDHLLVFFFLDLSETFYRMDQEVLY